jgi:hypothetical protein
MRQSVDTGACCDEMAYIGVSGGRFDLIAAPFLRSPPFATLQLAWIRT